MQHQHYFYPAIDDLPDDAKVSLDGGRYTGLIDAQGQFSMYVLRLACTSTAP